MRALANRKLTAKMLRQFINSTGIPFFTTQMGLAVAIPGLIIGGMLDRKASAIRHELAQIKDLLCAGTALEIPA